MSNLRRALRLLELLTQAPDGARLTDLAQSLGVNRAIPHRALSELIDMGYVRQDPDTERYLATFKLGALGVQQLEVAGLGRWANEALRDLADKTKELVRMAVMTDGGLRWVAKAQGSNSMLILDPANGAEPMLHATATGKAWLSTLPEDEVRRILGTGKLAQRTARTKVDPEVVLAEIALARKLGYAITQEEVEDGISAIAVPIYDRGRADRAVATVSVAGPSVRLSTEALTGFLPEIRKTAQRLGEEWATYLHLAPPG
jgi:IclR family transcriptional regulator, acetate operon repressor